MTYNFFDEPTAPPTESSHQSQSAATAISDDRPECELPPLPNSQSVVFDIETGPVWESDSIEDAKAFCRPLGIDFDPESVEHPGEFDPKMVAVGNLKDPAKIEAKVEQKRQEHNLKLASWQDDLAAAEREFWIDVIQQAPLSPVFGKVYAIGFVREGEVIIDDGFPIGDEDSEEHALLNNFWSLFCELFTDGRSMLGWNINTFDVPFLAARSAVIGVEIPPILDKGKWLSPAFVDLMILFNAGQRQSPWKLNSSRAKRVAKAMGFGRSDHVLDDGSEWWKLWLGDEASRERAVEYLTWDVIEETLIADRLGVI